ncbi:hypothetical protein F4808DRAFT_460003 [Astrocystis sublimbata]|nr:hypothetical protein F4808DRAFT_460003 [Astrocystis sublimbata]
MSFLGSAELTSTPITVDNEITSKPDVIAAEGLQSSPKLTAIVAMKGDDDVGAVESQSLKSGTSGTELKHGPIGRSAAHLWCTENGRSHYVLLDFGYSKCQLCREVLDPDEPFRAKNAKEDSHGKKDSDDNKHSPKMTFAIEYLDEGGKSITSQPWGTEPFDLRTARGDAMRPEASVFEVVTLLGTTIREDSWPPWKVSDLLESGILNNPSIGVTIVGSNMVIKSPEIIKAIANMVHYYPSVDIEGETISIEEPYPLIAHHIEQLEAHSKSAQGIADQGLTTHIDDGLLNVTSDESLENLQSTSTHLNVLLDYIKSSVYKNDIRDELLRYGTR